MCHFQILKYILHGGSCVCFALCSRGLPFSVVCINSNYVAFSQDGYQQETLKSAKWHFQTHFMVRIASSLVRLEESFSFLSNSEFKTWLFENCEGVCVRYLKMGCKRLLPSRSASLKCKIYIHNFSSNSANTLTETVKSYNAILRI